MSWEIRTERDFAIGFSPSTGKSDEEMVTRLRYRKIGSRGRWHSFVIVGEVPKDLQTTVNAFEEKLSR